MERFMRVLQLNRGNTEECETREQEQLITLLNQNGVHSQGSTVLFVCDLAKHLCPQYQVHDLQFQLCQPPSFPLFSISINHESLPRYKKNNGYLAHPLKLVAAPEFRCSFLARPSSPSLACCGRWNPIFQQPGIYMHVNFHQSFLFELKRCKKIYLRCVRTVKTPPIIAQTFVMKCEKDLGTSVTKT